jgi:hypothetical protein
MRRLVLPPHAVRRRHGAGTHAGSAGPGEGAREYTSDIYASKIRKKGSRHGMSPLFLNIHHDEMMYFVATGPIVVHKRVLY